MVLEVRDAGRNVADGESAGSVVEDVVLGLGKRGRDGRRGRALGLALVVFRSVGDGESINHFRGPLLILVQLACRL